MGPPRPAYVTEVAAAVYVRKHFLQIPRHVHMRMTMMWGGGRLGAAGIRHTEPSGQCEVGRRVVDGCRRGRAHRLRAGPSAADLPAVMPGASSSCPDPRELPRAALSRPRAARAQYTLLKTRSRGRRSFTAFRMTRERCGRQNMSTPAWRRRVPAHHAGGSRQWSAYASRAGPPSAESQVSLRPPVRPIKAVRHPRTAVPAHARIHRRITAGET